jgi:flagellin
MGDVLGTAAASGTVRICLDDEVYYFGSASLATISGKENFSLGSAQAAASALATKINNSSTSFWAMKSGANVFVFAKNGGNNDTWLACDEGYGTGNSATVLNRITWQNLETGTTNNSGASFGLGGEHWGTMKPVQKITGDYGVTLAGRDVGVERDIKIASLGSGTTFDLNLAGIGLTNVTDITGFGPSAFTEVQNAAWGSWTGADIRTQSTAQEALDKLGDAIVKKDKVRADLGALQNRLENTMTNISIQAENLQASESRISDVDVATEMTNFTRNNIMAQAATSMLAQANSLAQLALSLLG